MNSLKQKWGHFLGLIFSPWLLIFLIGTVVSLVLSAHFKDNIPLSNLLAVIGSITGGIAGGIFQNEYRKMHDQSILEKKGRSALRNLEAIGEQVDQLTGWISAFSENVGKEGKRTLAEVGRHLSTITFNISAGVEDWIDVVPELQERAKIERKREEVLRTYVEELLENKKMLMTSKDEKQVSELKKKISNLEKQIRELKKSTNPGIIWNPSGGLSDDLDSETYLSLNETCSRCGKTFIPNSLISHSTLCPDCSREGLELGS